MPLPKPKEDENQSEFISRCIASDAMKNEYGDPSESEEAREQITAICYSQWREAQNNNSGGRHCGIHTHDIHDEPDYELDTAYYMGRKHLIAPVVLMVEGVHNGSHGPTLYTREELQKFPQAWNGSPLPVFHPEDDVGPICANDPEIIQNQSVGQLFNVHYVVEDGLGKLKGNIWVDEERCKEISPATLACIKEGRQLEVSTGLFSEDRQITGNWDGETYYGVARNIRPDHLALLPGARGACSWPDGCGVRNHQEQGKGGKNGMRRTKHNGKGGDVSVNASTPNYSGTSSSDWSAPNLEDFNVSENSWDDLSQEEKGKVAGHYLIGSASADNFEDLVFPVVEPSTGNLNENALRAVIGGRGAQADISAEERRSARRIAYRLLNEKFDADLDVPENLEENSKKRDRHIRANMASGSYQDKMSRVQRALDAMDTEDRIHYLVDLYDDHLVYRVEMVGEGMKLYKRSYSIGDDGQVSFGDDRKEVMERTEYVEVESAIQNAEGGEQMSKRQEKIQALIDSEQTQFSEDNRPCLQALSDEQLDAITPGNSGGEGGQATANSQSGGGQSGGEQGAGEGAITEDQVMQALQSVVQDDQKFLSMLPPERREEMQYGLKLHREKRQSLVSTITSNSDKFTEQELAQKDTEELEKMAELVKPAANYAPMAGTGPSTNEVGGGVKKPAPLLPGGLQANGGNGDASKGSE